MSIDPELDDYNLGRLTRISAREAIGGEATHFTPWLASHIDELAKCIRVGLRVGAGEDVAQDLREHTEVPVGGFSLDIRAQTDDNRIVAIENQYGRSDHDHLGKAITYASGVAADVVIWIAEEFTVPHLDAMRWLNHRTDSECGSFAIELAFYRIGNSPPAPRLTCLVEPSEWDRNRRRVEVASSQWSIDEFLSQIPDDGDRTKVATLMARLDAVGGRYWCGKRGGSIQLHPLPDESATLGLSLNARGQVCVSGMWRNWQSTYGHPAYGDIATFLGLSPDGPASAQPLAGFDVDGLWNAAVRSAEKLRDREVDASE